MIKLIPLFAALLFVTQVHAEGIPSIDWDSTLADIKAREEPPLEEESETSLSYRAQFQGNYYRLEYRFSEEGTLANVLYIKPFPANGNACLLEFHRVSQAYRSELGKPSREAAPGLPELQQSGIAQACRAVGEGNLMVMMEWSTNSANTVLVVVLSTWAGQPFVGITFSPSA